MALSQLEANFDRILDLEQQTGMARAQVQEALVNLMQSRHELSSSGAMLSAATRAQMGKRSVSQLESVKGLLDLAVDSAALVRSDARTLRDEVATALQARDAALDRAASAEATAASACAVAEETSAAQVLTASEIASRAEAEAAAAHSRAEAAELRAEQAERSFTLAEKARAGAEKAAEEAAAVKAAAEGKLGAAEAQLSREREVLARVMSENVLFVKRLQLSEAERTRAVEEKEALRTSWRSQTEEWFRTAAEEMQSQLLSDWGASEGLQTELLAMRQGKAQTEASHSGELKKAKAVEETLAAEVERLQQEGALAAAQLQTLSERALEMEASLKASQHAQAQMAAQSEVRVVQVSELQAAEAMWRQKGETNGAELLAVKEALLAERHDAGNLREALSASEAEAKLQKHVNQKVRAESAEEHGRLLEAQAKLDDLREQYSQLQRQNVVLVQSVGEQIMV